MTFNAGASHIGGCLSVIEILGAIFRRIRDFPDEQSRLILSKGHAAAALYATMDEFGISQLDLGSFCRPGSELIGHASSRVNGIGYSTGSLGHGLAIGTGVGAVLRDRGAAGRAYVVMSDGECAEGSVWEAARLAAQEGICALTAVVDANGWQSFSPVPGDLSADRLADKWRAFGWTSCVVDGHSPSALQSAIDGAYDLLTPTAIVARTTKGRGVSFMENRPEFHYRPPTSAELQAALAELGDDT